MEFFIGNDIIKNKHMLFSDSLIKNDQTQKILLQFINKTEQLMRTVLTKYDLTADCSIIPSFDLGIPNNVTRLAGGFATGCIVAWKSSIPFVPIDITLNVCSSSYFYVDKQCVKTIAKRINAKSISELRQKGEKHGFLFNFESGNHFIILAKNASNQYVLFLHSSDASYKIGENALYPTTHSWYINHQRKYFDSDSGRYLNYLIDESAEKYINIALSNKDRNTDIHTWIAQELCPQIQKGVTIHHYGMPFENIVQIGSYMINANEVVPIFSRPNYPIILFKPHKDMWKINVDGNQKYIIPHGWGQKISNITNLLVSANKLVIHHHNNNITSLEISEHSKISDAIVAIRDFGFEFFDNPDWNNIIAGEICDIFYPIHAFSRHGEISYDN